jgi:(2S)-methylsuccinyl-CoA dehydrogenase
MSKPDLEHDSLATARDALQSARTYLDALHATCLKAVSADGRVDLVRLDQEQRCVHGLAWTATHIEGLAALLSWADQASRDRPLNPVDRLIVQIGFGEYLARLVGGVPMSQSEFFRPSDLGSCAAADALRADPVVREFIVRGNSAKCRGALASLLADGASITDALSDESLNMIRQQTRRFVDERIAPDAHRWHLANALIPPGIIKEMAELGHFGVTISPEFGGLGLGKLAMCIVSEELSRGWIGVGSLGTRAEIASELIGAHGTERQKTWWLPRIASGEVLAAAVFTEPNAGSDLGSLNTRARKTNGGSWVINGSKTWITHAARSNLMMILARTDASAQGHRGLSIFLAAKQSADSRGDFPDAGLSGSEIQVLGYRGMREYALSFDDFAVPGNALLGETDAHGFAQLMSSFESARIQTAARAVGVARNALDLALQYAKQRRQFRKPLVSFPRISDKLSMMAVETTIARELTYSAARAKDSAQRCDVEAGMAKLLAARVAWSNADDTVQVYGGNGYAIDSPASRVLCDARVLSIFEGSAEIQAHIVGRRLLLEGAAPADTPDIPTGRH